MAARLHHRVFGALRFEMILGFAKFDSGPLLEMPHHFAGKFQVPIQARADRRAAEGKLFQDRDGPSWRAHAHRKSATHIR